MVPAEEVCSDAEGRHHLAEELPQTPPQQKIPHCESLACITSLYVHWGL